MKRWTHVLLYALYLLILSSLFIPLSHASWAEFARELLIRLAIVVAFAAATLRFLNAGAVVPYRITEIPPQTAESEDVSPIALQDPLTTPQSQVPRGRRGALFVFWVVVLAVYCVTQTSLWSHQAWVSRFMETAIRWAILLICWGLLLLLWMPKPGADQPEALHVVPPDSERIDAPEPKN